MPRDPENNYVTHKQENHVVEAVVGKHNLVEVWVHAFGEVSRQQGNELGIQERKHMGLNLAIAEEAAEVEVEIVAAAPCTT